MLFKNYATAPVAGFNQSKKLIRQGKVKLAYLACDAQGAIVSEFSFLCELLYPRGD